MPESRKSYIPQNEEQLLKHLERVDGEAIAYKAPRTKGWKEAVEIYRGNHWDKAKEGNPLFQADLITTRLDRKASLLVESKPIVDVMPAKEGLRNTSRVLRDTLRAGWDANEVQMGLEALSSYLRAMGSGLFKVIWDNEAAMGLGDWRMTPIDPRTVRFDPFIVKAQELNSAQYLVHETSIPLHWVSRHFPDKLDKIRVQPVPPPGEHTETQSFGQRFIRSPLASFISRPTGAAGQAFAAGAVPYVKMREFWLSDPARDGEGVPIFPEGRVLYVVGEGKQAVILNPADDDSKNPYWDGWHPFELLDNRPDIDHPWGRSEVQAMKRMQEAFNRIGHLIVRNIIKSVPWVQVQSGALAPETIQFLKDFGDIVLEERQGRTATRTLPQFPMELGVRMMDFILKLFDSETGLIDNPIQGTGRFEVRSPELLEGLQAEAQILVRAQARRLESFLERCGQKAVSRILQFYTSDRLMTLVGDDLTLKEYHFEIEKLRADIVRMADAKVKEDFKDMTVDPADRQAALVAATESFTKGAWRQLRFKIVPLSSLASTKTTRAMMIRQLAQAGLVPSRMVLEELGIQDPMTLLNEAMTELAKRQMLGLIPPGQPGRPLKQGQV